ncbi:MAG: YdcF family protein [Dorea sp.]|nr:YdcF family protein [Dorea sp.]
MKKTVINLATFVGVSNALLFELMFRNPKKTWDYQTYDCAVVCGFPANPDGTISAVAKSRTEKGIELYQAGKVRKLLFSGAAVRNQYTEAEVMKAYAMEAGVPEEDILTETKAGSTYANMKLSLPILMKHRIKTIAVVTNDWHLRKTDHYTRKMHMEYVMVCAERPEGESIFKNIWMHIQTNATAYYNMWQGLY